MSVYSLELTIDARELAPKAFLAVKRFDSTVVMGTVLQLMRDCKPIEILFDRPDREDVLVRLIHLLDDLDRLQIQYDISANNVPPSSPLWQPITWTRSNVVSALEALRQRALEAEEGRKLHEQWLNSPEGREYVATIERLHRVRDFLRSRWGELGFEKLRPTEQDYVYVWWLCVEVDNGGFDQYFFNSTGDSAMLAYSALQSLGADEATAILSDALQLFETVGGFNADRTKRWECLDALPDNPFDDVTRRFYELSEDLRLIALKEVERDYAQNNIAFETDT